MGPSSSYEQHLFFAMVALENPGPQAVVSETQAKNLREIPNGRTHDAHGSLVLTGWKGCGKQVMEKLKSLRGP